MLQLSDLNPAGWLDRFCIFFEDKIDALNMCPVYFRQELQRLITERDREIAARDARIAGLEAERSAVVRDAERWRYGCAIQFNLQPVMDAMFFTSECPYYDKDEYDAATDAAINATKEKKG